MADARDFSWLEGTYWYVPAADLPAMQYDAARNTLAWIVDQTVWHITGYPGDPGPARAVACCRRTIGGRSAHSGAR